MLSSKQMFDRRRRRNRTDLKKKSAGLPRLAVHRTSRHIYAQLIDDAAGHTLAAASTLDTDFKKSGKTGADSEAASQIGASIAKKALANGVEAVVFDRGGYIFHGRVKALADAAREAGLKF